MPTIASSTLLRLFAPAAACVLLSAARRPPPTRRRSVGNTQPAAAHLHFQPSDGPDAIASNGRPFAFDGFRLAGCVTNLDAFMTGADATVEKLVPAPRRREQMP